MLINEFYANREVFITGGTGFLGKALIEKLLRDVPQIKGLYVLLRGKKSIGVEQRLEQLKKDKVFEQIHQKCPEVLNKLHAIQGDSQELGLGIQPNDLKLLKNVSIIFHMAANVKFDDNLRSSILLNTRGTHELIKIAENLQNLVVFMHCSTAYCNPFEKVVEERVYSMLADWRKTIKIAETYDEETLNALFYKYTGYYPNTYTFTKNLSEQIIQDYSTKLPMFIFRPSVVLTSFKEPTFGWTDNMNGALGGLTALGIGILPVLYSKGEFMLDCVPVDMVTKLTIVAAYKRGMQSLRKEPVANDVEVVNCAAGDVFRVNLYGAAAIYENAIHKNPMENCVWYYDYPILTGCYYNFLLQLVLMTLTIAIVLDTILRLKGQKPMMIKQTRRIAYTMKAVMFFTTREFKMRNQNMVDLEDSIPQSELAIYGVKREILDLDINDYFGNMVEGVKYYLFNQPRQATAGAQKRAKILFIVNRSIKFFTLTLLIIYLWSIVSKF